MTPELHISKVINQLHDKQYYSANKSPNNKFDNLIANDLKDYFHHKVNTIYSNIEGHINISSSIDNKTDHTISNNNYSSTENMFSNFPEIPSSDIAAIIKTMSNKSCDSDPIPMWILKSCLNEVLPIVTNIVNESLRQGIFPDLLKTAIIRPCLKKT